MIRRLFNLLALLSLAAAIATVWLYERQVRFGGPELELFSTYCEPLHARYTLRADTQGVRLYVPPSVPPSVSPFEAPERSAKTASVVGQLRNDQIEWPIIVTGYNFHVGYFGPTEPWQPLFYEEYELPKHEAVPALLEALEDPQRFVAAHYCLMNRTEELPQEPAEPWPGTLTLGPDGTTFYNHYGLRLGMSHFKKRGEPTTPAGIVTEVISRVHADPAQIPTLVARWHRHLDQPAGMLPYCKGIAGAMVLPAMWCLARSWQAVRRRRQRLARRCVHCGYDLRATPDRCPECGAAA